MGTASQNEINFAGFEIDSCYFDTKTIAKTVAFASALTQQHVLASIEMETIARQLRNMHQPLHVTAIKRHEQAEAGHPADDAIKRFTDFILHVITLEPGPHTAAGIVRATLG